MSATNSTPIINLPLFIGTDKPAWLVDWNNAMNIIDSNISALQSAEGGTAASLAALSQSVQALSGTVDQHTTALQTATQAIAGNTGSINTINSLIGNGQPTTTDKTIIGAINEINAKIPEGGEVAADDVTFDGTTSGLQATDVQAAIDEVNAKIPQGADGVNYNNTQSGLQATDVQAAIDELNDKIGENTIGTAVTIDSRYSSNAYECAADGYAIATLAGVGTAVGRLLDSTGATIAPFGGVTEGNATAYYIIPVRKGMKIQFVSTSGVGALSFMPFN